MFSRQDLIGLSDYRPEGQLVTSLYLTVDPAQRARKRYLTEFKNLAKRASLPGEITREQRLAIDRDLEWMGEFLESRPGFSPSRGVALFSASATDYRRLYPLPLEVPDRLAVLDRPMVSPLILAVSRYRPGLVVTASRGGGRLHRVYCGQLEEIATIQSDVPPGVREAGFSGYDESRVSRRGQELLDRHLNLLGGMVAEHWDRGDGYSWLVVSGTDEMTARLTGSLPDDLAGRVLGTVSSGLDAPAPEVLRGAMELEGRSRMEWEKAAVDRLLSGLGSGEPVAVGLADASAAMFRNAVHTLLVAHGSSHPGFVCASCRHLVVEGDRCPACRDGDLIPVADAVDKLVERGLRAGSRVEAVARGLGLDAHGGVGAFLRF